MKEVSYSIPIYQIDAFTEISFKGNPAAICLIDQDYNNEILQEIAAEMNLSETAFIYVNKERNLKTENSFKLRWFTPKNEVSLCGHATLASAALLFYEIEIESDEISFNTLSGTLKAQKADKGVKLDFPENKPKKIDPPEALLETLGITDYVDAAYSEVLTDLLIELRDEKAVNNVLPDYERMKKLDLAMSIRGIIITSEGNNGYDFVSRFFAPWVGINEDPVTGSAHTILTPYWAEKLGKKDMRAFQMSERGGELVVKLLKSNRVEIFGNSILVLKGRLFF